MRGAPAPAGVRIDITNLSSRQVYELGSHREAVYWLYGDDGRLLYVGRAGFIDTRFSQHRRKQPWWPQVTRKIAAWYETYTEAKSAEALAIAIERPLYNKRAEPLPVPDSGIPDGWLHLVSAEVAERQLDNLARDVESGDLHIGVRRRGDAVLAAVIVPYEWHEAAIALLADLEAYEAWRDRAAALRRGRRAAGLKPQDRRVVHHIDGDPTNNDLDNDLDNLRVVDPRENGAGQ